MMSPIEIRVYWYFQRNFFKDIFSDFIQKIKDLIKEKNTLNNIISYMYIENERIYNKRQIYSLPDLTLYERRRKISHSDY